LGGMISSSNNHGGRQCCSRPKPSNTGSSQGLTRTQNTERTKDERNERTDFTNLVSLPLYTPRRGLFIHARRLLVGQECPYNCHTFGEYSPTLYAYSPLEVATCLR
jgi:hypothetical protein